MNTNPLLIETIRIQNGRVRNIEYHNQRCNSSRKAIFGVSNMLDLRRYIDTSNVKDGEVKCRITYDQEVRKIEYEPYSIRDIRSLAYVEIGSFSYKHKYADRKRLKEFFDQRGNKDDILMTKKGMITDTYYANVALLQNGKWYTPENPLLKGSYRARLLSNGKISKAKIHIDQIDTFEAITIFNAMIPFKRIVIKI